MIKINFKDEDDPIFGNLKYKRREIYIHSKNKFKNSFILPNECKINIINYSVEVGSLNSKFANSTDRVRLTNMYYGRIYDPYIGFNEKKELILNPDARITISDSNYSISSWDINKLNKWNFDGFDFYATEHPCPAYRSNAEEILIPDPRFYNMEHQYNYLGEYGDFIYELTANEIFKYYILSDFVTKDTTVYRTFGLYGNDRIQDESDNNYNYIETDILILCNEMHTSFLKLNINRLGLVIVPGVGYEIKEILLNDNSFKLDENIKEFDFLFKRSMNDWYSQFDRSLNHPMSEEIKNSYIMIIYGISMIKIKLINRDTNKLVFNCDMSTVNLYSFDYCYGSK